MEIKKINYKGLIFKLKSTNELYRYKYGDCILEIYKNDIKIKKYKIKHSFEFYYKIQKTQILSSNILGIFDNINSEVSVSRIFFDKLIGEI